MKMKIIVKCIGNENIKKEKLKPGRKSRGVKEINIGLSTKYYLLLFPNRVVDFIQICFLSVLGQIYDLLILPIPIHYNFHI